MSKKRVFIIHGWEGSPDNHWFPWLKRELESRDYVVIASQFPGEQHPVLAMWLTELSRIVGEVDSETYFVGHSLGCITILKYLETVPVGTNVAGAILVAGFISSLGIPEIENFIAVPVDAMRIRAACSKIVAFQSTNDDFVSLAHGEVLRDELGAKLVVVENAGHFCAEDGYESFPSLLEKLLAL
ncbi:MAG: alpha/beta hydrolase [Patescibacteria group bacterium]|jgi:hypothetical protein